MLSVLEKLGITTYILHKKCPFIPKNGRKGLKSESQIDLKKYWKSNLHSTILSRKTFRWRSANIRDLTKLRRRLRRRYGDSNVKKPTIGLVRKTTTLHVHNAFLYCNISLPSVHDYGVK